MDPSHFWRFLPVGYLVTIAIETPILLIGLSKPHPIRRRLAAGVWLTACTYPIVVLVLPMLMGDRASSAAYLWVAETFAPLAECAIFAAAFWPGAGLTPGQRTRDLLAITAANLASFLIGEWLNKFAWLTP